MEMTNSMPSHVEEWHVSSNANEDSGRDSNHANALMIVVGGIHDELIGGYSLLLQLLGPISWYIYCGFTVGAISIRYYLVHKKL